MENKYLSTRVREIPPSGIRKFFDLAATMEGVVSLGVGEPDFVTPWHAREACINSLEEGYTSYTPNAGLLELREGIAKYLSDRFQVSYNPKTEMIVTVGGSEALDIALRTIINPGDEVLVVEPCFVSYAPLVDLCGGVSVRVSTSPDNGFKLTPEQLEAVITPKTKAIMICSPNNPTGTFLNKQDLEALSKIIIKHDLLVLSDEIYAELTYDEEFTSIATIEGMRERTFLISGFSKGFAMTGWRLGYICAPQSFIAPMLKVHQYAIMCAPTMSQFAAVESLKHGASEVNEMVHSYRRRRNFFVESLNEIGLECHNPGGAFYAFPSIRCTGMTSEEFAERLLMEQKVAVVPGHVFGESGEGYIRCSYASSMESLQEALKRMDTFLKGLKK